MTMHEDMPDEYLRVIEGKLELLRPSEKTTTQVEMEKAWDAQDYLLFIAPKLIAEIRRLRAGYRLTRFADSLGLVVDEAADKRIDDLVKAQKK